MQPYLHESRHRHALNRARGSGGRFLNTKKLQGSMPTSDGVDMFGSAELLMTANSAESGVHPGTYREAASTTALSEITSASSGEDIFQQAEFRFSGYPSHTLQGCSADMNDSGRLQRLLSSVE